MGRWLLTVGVLAMAFAGTPASAGEGDGEDDWELYNKGIKWESSLGDAATRAEKEGKLIVYFPMVGDLNKEGC